MDLFADLLPLIAFAVIYLIGRLFEGLGEKQRKPSEKHANHPTGFGELLRQIEEAAREASGQEPSGQEPSGQEPSGQEPSGETAPQPEERQKTDVAVARPLDKADLSETDRSFDTVFDRMDTTGPGDFAEHADLFSGGPQDYRHAVHGFEQGTFSEEAFEREGRNTAPTPHRAGHLDETPHASMRRRLAASPTGRRTSKRAASWYRRLSDPQSARDALVLKEIFDGPWAPRLNRTPRKRA